MHSTEIIQNSKNRYIKFQDWNYLQRWSLSFLQGCFFVLTCGSARNKLKGDRLYKISHSLESSSISHVFKHKIKTSCYQIQLKYRLSHNNLKEWIKPFWLGIFSFGSIRVKRVCKCQLFWKALYYWKVEIILQYHCY